MNVPISGQYVWIRRAETLEEEKDSLMDIKTTIGKIKKEPGTGYSDVGGVGKGLFSSNDAYLWYLPARARTLNLGASAVR